MRARRRAWRTLLSALAGGGLTAVTFGGPLSTLAQGEGGWTPIVTTSSGTTATSQSAASTPPAQTTRTAKESDWESATTSSASTTHTGVTQVRTQTQTVTSVEAPAVVLQRRQKSTAGTETGVTSTTGSSVAETEAEAAAAAGNNVAEAPQIVAAQLGGLEDELAGAAATSQALSFYRIPLFLLPIYQAAAVQYGVPWQILAAINEIETDYGNDLSVSTAGAVGWMQFMPSTWLQYGVDALDAGYADPYNPVDAVFAAARYLKAAGAATDLSGAILSYNHSQAYVQSVLLRAKLISAYPGGVIATLTGLTDGRLPVTGTPVHWGQPIEPAEAATASPATTAAQSASSATANAVAVTPAALVAQAPGAGVAAGSKAISPAAAAAATAAKPAATGREFVELTTAPGAHVVAVQDGRITGMGSSRKLGHYLILRDVYGDVFTYAGLGSIASTYLPPKPARTASAPAASPNASTTTTSTSSAAASTLQQAAGSSAAATTSETSETAATSASQTAAPSSVEAGQPAESGQPIEASGQSEGGAEPTSGTTAGKGLALLVVAPQGTAAAGTGAGESLLAHAAVLADSAAVADAAAAEFAEVTPVGPKKLFSLAGLIGRGTTASAHTSRLPLRVGSLVSQGTILGRVLVPHGDADGHLRFAIRPDGDPRTINPSAVLSSWQQLGTALHPKGAEAETELVGATASGVFLESKSSLERTVLSDPDISMSACARGQVASGAIDTRVLAVLAFLSRSGLRPTVGALACSKGTAAPSGYVATGHLGDAVAITKVNGIPIAGHQGSGSIADTTIRALLTLQGKYQPHAIVSLMRYPGAPNTHARADHASYIEVAFAAPVVQSLAAHAKVAAAAHSAGKGGATAVSPLAVTNALGATQWEQLISRIGSLPKPKIATKPSSSAISDK